MDMLSMGVRVTKVVVLSSRRVTWRWYRGGGRWPEGAMVVVGVEAERGTVRGGEPEWVWIGLGRPSSDAGRGERGG